MYTRPSEAKQGHGLAETRVPDRKRTGVYSPLSSFTGGKRGILGRKGGLVLGRSPGMSEEERVMDTSIVGSVRHGEHNG